MSDDQMDFFDNLPPDMTLAEARAHLLKHIDKGVGCLCCGRFNKVYKRNFNSGMARSLIHIFKISKQVQPQEGWIHVQKYFAREFGVTAQAMDYSQLKNWKLIEPKLKTPEDNQNIKHPGLWRITEKGIKVVSELKPVPKRVFLMNNRVVGFDDETRNIVEALGKKFSYPELMNN